MQDRQTKTWDELCRDAGKSPASVGRQFNRIYGDGWDKTNVPTQDKVDRILKKTKVAKTKNKSVRPVSEIMSLPAPEKTEDKKAFEWPDIEKVRRIAFDLICLLIVVGHSILIWYDCVSRWGMPGFIGGGVTFLIVCNAAIISTDPSKNRTSSYAVSFVFLVDIAAYWVHYPTFMESAKIGPIETSVLCVFLCACSWISLYLFRDSKN